jgi:hypothetical protein
MALNRVDYLYQDMLILQGLTEHGDGYELIEKY